MKSLTKIIINQDRLCDIEQNETKGITESTEKKREMKRKEQLKSLLDRNDSTDTKRKRIEICCETGPQTG